MPRRKAVAVPLRATSFYPSIREALDDLAPIIEDRISHGVQLNQIIEVLEQRLGVPNSTLQIYLRGATISPVHEPRITKVSKPSRR
jgi:hypothetical protein